MDASRDGAGTLERAVGYALGSVAKVSPELLSRPTPCPAWDLRDLLHHVNDSLAALCEGIDNGQIGSGGIASTDGAAGDPRSADDPTTTFRDRVRHLLGTWAAPMADGPLITIGGLPLTVSTLADTGAVEIAVHGWDIAQACGLNRPIPPDLAVELLTVAPRVVVNATRHVEFAPAVAVSPSAGPGDRLVAFLGRRPRR